MSALNAGFVFTDLGNGYFRVNLPGGIQIAMAYGVGVSHNGIVGYGSNFSTVGTVLVADASTNGTRVGAWKNDGSSFVAWVRDGAGNPTSTTLSFIAIGHV